MADEVNPLLQGEDLPARPAAVRRPAGYNPLLEEAETPHPVARPSAEIQPDLAWSDVLSQAGENAWPSAKAAAKGIVEPFLSPIETGKGLYEIGKGLTSKAAGAFMDQDPAKKEENERAVNAIGKFYADRYGSVSGLKNAIAKDPAGVLMDASMALTGGGSLAARAPGVIGKAGEVARLAGRATDPINLAVKAAGTVAAPALKATSKVANIPFSMASGVPRETLDRAFTAGRQGSEGFRDMISGQKPVSEVVDAAHEAMSNLYDKRRSAYEAGMQGMRTSQQVIDMTPILQTTANAYDNVMHGSQIVHADAKTLLDQINRKVSDWHAAAQQDPVLYSNITGLDKLKQAVGDIVAGAEPKSVAQRVGTQVYNSIKNEIKKVDPQYAKVMDQYADATNQLNQIRKTLSMGNNATVDSTLRKLLLAQKQVDGHKGNLLSLLNKENPEIANMIAGHLLHPITPVGFRGGINSALMGLTGYGAYSGAVHPAVAIAHGAASSPRVAGELNYLMGRTASGAGLPAMATMPAMMGADINKAMQDTGPKRPERKYESPYFPGDEEEGFRPLTIHRATGGKVGSEGYGQIAARLVRMVDQAKKAEDSNTKELLNEPDEAVVKALHVAQQAI